MEEKELYLPIKAYFTSRGFDVYGEVKSVDIIAKTGDLLFAIELKKDLNLQLIIQGTKRQRLTDDVFLAIPKPTSRITRGKAFKDKIFLIKRLGLGLIYVDFKAKIPHVTLPIEPTLFHIKTSQTRSKKKKEAIFKEIKNRHSDYNIGGTRGKTMTAYKEGSLRLLKLLEDGQVHTTKELREQSGLKDCTPILYKNYNGWFLHIKKGHYQMSSLGKEALLDHADFYKLILNL